MSLPLLLFRCGGLSPLTVWKWDIAAESDFLALKTKITI